ncbi:MAG: Hsp20/alpha crystallin family protein [Spirochaetes bacterium]|nr:Hsp20/alpha crystallin family protein [Spirochaetota bacterium]
MKAMTYRPITIQNALSDIDRYFESFFGDSLMGAAPAFNRLPAVDVRETDSAYTLEMELPGFDEKNVEINVNGHNLSVVSKQEQSKEEGGDETKGAYLLRERRLNTFRRSFKLPEGADPENVSAVFKNGVLCMEIKKRAESQTRTIQINAG